jgi:hypothetical protein
MIERGGHPDDPRDLIFESYRIDGIRIEECRSIFLDWALGLPAGRAARDAITDLLARYQAANPDHPMTQVMIEGLGSAAQPRRRGGRSGRQS